MSHPSPHETTPHAPTPHEITILVVDPNPITLIATAGALDTQGYACICARTAEAAEKAAAQDALDAAVIDVADDAEAALRLVARLREVSGSAELPVLLIADGCWAGLQQRCEKLAAVRCLFKPIDPNALLDLLQHSLWMPPLTAQRLTAQQLTAQHRRRGTRPPRPGWVSL